MKAKERYLVVSSVIFVLLYPALKRGFVGIPDSTKTPHQPDDEPLSLPSSLSFLEGLKEGNVSVLMTREEPCTMETCFDFTKCRPPFLHYVYPPEDGDSVVGESYSKILRALKNSPFSTKYPDQACIFILAFDTLDRDVISEHYVRGLRGKIERLPTWNGGLNHLIFNLYSGTYPDYSEDLGFNPGKAILAKASLSVESYRRNFDISLPLFHSNHPEKSGRSGLVKNRPFPLSEKKHFLAFKGKRYVYGIGSEVRNSLYHLHNGRDLALLTTCKHGKDWEKHQDDRCEEDNRNYDQFDFESLLNNSTFCLVPRGRRLGSYRFMETLQAGCVPVLLSNGWVLPFHERIDWSLASVGIDERVLMQVPEMLREISPSEIFLMRQQTQFLSDKYFSSIEAIIETTLAIIHERIEPQSARTSQEWNSDPGALWIKRSKFSTYPTMSPVQDRFIAVIRNFEHSDEIGRLVKNITATDMVKKIFIWQRTKSESPWINALDFNVDLEVINSEDLSSSLGSANYPIFSVNSLSAVTTDEISFTFAVWKDFPDRIVGLTARLHYYNNQAWTYSSKWRNEYSMVPLDGAFYHSYYQNLLEQMGGYGDFATAACNDILMNALVSDITGKAPIKVTQRKEMMIKKGSKKERLKDKALHLFQVKQSCLNAVMANFGYDPFRKSKVRLDPVLYKDAVANARKKYRKMELISSD